MVRTLAKRELEPPLSRARLIANVIQDADREHFVSVCLDARHRPTHVEVVSVGTLVSSVVHPREVFKGAILANAHAILVGHNHPSGDVTPSAEDRAVSERLRQAGELLGIELLDAIIVGAGDKFFSMADNSMRKFAP